VASTPGWGFIDNSSSPGRNKRRPTFTDPTWAQDVRSQDELVRYLTINRPDVSGIHPRGKIYQRFLQDGFPTPKQTGRLTGGLNITFEFEQRSTDK
jgi:hypothetical protein